MRFFRTSNRLTAIALFVGLASLSLAPVSPAWADEEGAAVASPATPTIVEMIDAFVKWVDGLVSSQAPEGEGGHQVDPSG